MKYTPILTLSTILAACGSSSSPADSTDCKPGRVWDPMSGECVGAAQDASLEDAMAADAMVPTRFPGIIYFTAGVGTQRENNFLQYDTAIPKTQGMVDQKENIVDITNIGNPVLSPTGIKIVYTHKIGEGYSVEMYDLAVGESKLIMPTKFDTRFTWEDDNTFIMAASSEQDGFLTTSLYRYHNGNVTTIQSFPLQQFTMNISVLDVGIKKVLAYDCVPKENIERAERERENYNITEINSPREICTADIRGDEFFVMSTSDVAHSNYELLGTSLQFIDPSHWGYNGQTGVYAPCKQQGDNTNRLCVIPYGASSRIVEEVLLPEVVSFTQLVYVPKHDVFILNLEKIFDRNNNLMLNSGFTYPEVDGKKLFAPFQLAGFRTEE